MASRLSTFRSYLFGPSVKGKLIYENADKASRFTGLHGTRLSHIRDQMKKGEFEQRNKDLYVYPNWEWNATRAAFWAKNKKDAVIVEVGSDNPTLANRALDTEFFSKESQLKILRVWEISSTWKLYAWKSPPN